MYSVVYTRWSNRHGWSQVVTCPEHENAEAQGKALVIRYRQYFPGMQAAVLDVENIQAAPKIIRGNKLTPLEVEDDTPTINDQ